MDRYLLVRAASIYIAVAATAAVWVWRRPGDRAWSGALLATTWNVPTLLILNAAAPHLSWWRYDANGGLLLGMPVDLLFAWAWLWGAVPALAFPSTSLVLVMLGSLAVDVALMPSAAPVVRLDSYWLLGDAVGVVTALLPAQLLARWTARDERLIGRAVLQMLTFVGLLFCFLPVVAIEGSGSAWIDPLTRPMWQRGLLVQLLALPALVGLTAVQEFVTRGRGTPVPFDPPRRLVTTGIYAYIANPMQVSATVSLLLLGLILWNPWVAVAGIMAHVYSVGLAGWDEHDDLRRRFGDAWIDYGRNVRRWIPRWRPWIPIDRQPSRLFVSARCDMCRDVARWFARRQARQLLIVPAETHPSRALRRITYEPADGSHPASGIEAIARALEHIHFGWALVGFALRLPIASRLFQLLADASGAEPRRLDYSLPNAPPTFRDEGIERSG